MKEMNFKVFFVLFILIIFYPVRLLAEEIHLVTLPPGINPDLVQIDSTDSTFKVAYRSKSGNQEKWVVDGVEEKTYDEVGEFIERSADGKLQAYSARHDQQWFVVTNGRSGPYFHKVGDPVISPNGKTVAYQAIAGNSHYMVVDGKRGPAYEGVLPPAFSPDSKLVYGILRNARWHYVIDGKEGPPSIG